MVYQWMKRRMRVEYLYRVLIFIGFMTFAIVGLHRFITSRTAQSLSSIASFSHSVEKEWGAFSFYISHTPQLVNLGTSELLVQQGKPFYYLSFVDGQLVSASEENTLATSSEKGEKTFIWWYGAETFFNTKGLHWVQIKDDIVISELYVYEPIPISHAVKTEEIGNHYLNVPWVTVLIDLGVPETIFVEIHGREEVVFRLRYRATTGRIFELAGDMKQVKYVNKSLVDTTFWRYTNNCASFTSETSEEVTGVDIDADDWPGIVR